jgi:hypothetical protein
MEEQLKLETYSFPEWRNRRKLARAKPLFYAVAIIAGLAVIFQLFLRYDYFESMHTVYRVDRITHQVCRVTHDKVDCSGRPANASVSTSISTSLSTSTAAGPKGR